MRGTDLVVPVGADQQQVPHFRVRGKMLEEVERRCIQPLQVVEEQRERVLFAREYPKEAPEHRLKAVLRFLRRQVRDRWLFADYELQFGNEVDYELTIRAQRLDEGGSPAAKSASLWLSSERTRLWKAWPSVAYGMSRLYWSNLPDANRPRCGTSALCSSFTTEDLPIPE